MNHVYLLQQLFANVCTLNIKETSDNTKSFAKSVETIECLIPLTSELLKALNGFKINRLMFSTYVLWFSLVTILFLSGQKFALNEEKTVIASVIRKYKVQSLETQEQIKLIAELILRPQNGIKLRLTPRVKQ